MSLGKWTEHALLVSFCLFGWILLKDHLPFSGFVFLGGYLFSRTKDVRTIVLFLLAVCLVCIPRSVSYPFAMDQGQAVIVSGKYAVLSQGRKRVLVYTSGPLVIDGQYKIDEEVKELDFSKGAFRFDGEKWAEQLNVSGQVDSGSVSLLYERNTPRRFLQKRIEERENGQAYLYKILLNVKTGEDTDTYFFSSGFSFAGILHAADLCLKYRIEKKKRKKILFVCNAVLCLVYRFPFVLVQSLLFRLLSFTESRLSVRTGISMLVIMCLFPHYVCSASFLFPAVYRLSFLWKKNRKTGCIWMGMCLQSLLFHKINLVQTIFYPFLKTMLGFLWLEGIAALFLPVPVMDTTFFEKIFFWIDKAVITGSMAGTGLFFYFLIILTMRKKKHFFISASVWLLVFQLTGFFHPFAEIAFINIGQGDAILVRGPLNRENVLIDTGKPGQWKNLQAYLDGEGIRHLNALFITHGDDDHNGSQQKVIDKYQPDQVITVHQDEVCTGRLCFFDLNEIDSDDENESSLAEYFQINGMHVLLTGDMNAFAEEQIVQKYPDLECDILKLSHHGSKTGSSEKFLNSLQPEMAVISSGPYSLYHHPSPEVIQRLLQRHIPYFDTKEDGDIRIICLCRWNILMTSSGKIGIIR